MTELMGSSNVGHFRGQSLQHLLYHHNQKVASIITVVGMWKGLLAWSLLSLTIKLSIIYDRLYYLHH